MRLAPSPGDVAAHRLVVGDHDDRPVGRRSPSTSARITSSALSPAGEYVTRASRRRLAWLPTTSAPSKTTAISLPNRRAMSSTTSRQASPLDGQLVVGPGELGDVVAVDEHERARRAEEVLGRPRRIAGYSAGQGERPAPAGADLDEAAETVGEGPRRRGPSSPSSPTRPASIRTPARSARSASNSSRWPSASSARRIASSRSSSTAVDAAPGRLGPVVGVPRRVAGRGELVPDRRRLRRGCGRLLVDASRRAW